ncbi:hypothetical protein AVEN_116590-1 [Araneus ventricosus]|uniref:Uncharacterized protein n=1 Tax=Araneus ventricosus TaxID=182803 RepID=A0A4Y2XDJ3_ARAVE|nr:hypothetical protein AVEN_116590-1 [Araneus ventricosus]
MAMENFVHRRSPFPSPRFCEYSKLLNMGKRESVPIASSYSEGHCVIGTFCSSTISETNAQNCSYSSSSFRQNLSVDRFNNFSSLVEYTTSAAENLCQQSSYRNSKPLFQSPVEACDKKLNLQTSFPEMLMPEIFETMTCGGSVRSFYFVICPIVKSIIVLRIKLLKKNLQELCFKNSLHKSGETGFLFAAEMDNKEQLLIKQAQSTTFAKELTALQDSKSVPVSSNLKYLYPFFDSNSILRVCGRLKRANLEYDAKHQVILNLQP